VELARQGATVVVMDPGVGVQGEDLKEPTAADTAQRIRAAGGTAMDSTVSVSDRAAVQDLFQEVKRTYGSLDIVVNPAGILRFPGLIDTTEDDWLAVLDVHFNGYLNVLSVALPMMVDAGYGRIVGFTSGVGLARTSVAGVAYGCAKRAVAALTWELGPLLPAGVNVNALSPIAGYTGDPPVELAARGKSSRAEFGQGGSLWSGLRRFAALLGGVAIVSVSVMVWSTSSWSSPLAGLARTRCGRTRTI
jgi:NAD(P)-dependent dehydrogenase (short-subunit alcohol dehydrogenase family)